MDSLEEECVLVLQILFTLRPTLPLSFLFSLCVLCKKSIDDWNVYLTCSLWGLSLSTVGSPQPGPKYQQQVLWAESLSGSIYWNFHFSKVFASQKKIFFRWDLLYKFHIAKRGVSLSVFHLFLLSHSSLQMRLKKKKKKMMHVLWSSFEILCTLPILVSAVEARTHSEQLESYRNCWTPLYPMLMLEEHTGSWEFSALLQLNNFLTVPNFYEVNILQGRWLPNLFGFPDKRGSRVIADFERERANNCQRGVRLICRVM